MAINGKDRISGDRPIVMITNDDGIEAPGLLSLVRVLVSTNLYQVRVCAPDSEKSAVSHSITWSRPLTAKHVEIEGAEAYAVSELWDRLQRADCNDQETSRLAELRNGVGEDRDTEDLLPGLQNYPYSTCPQSVFRFSCYAC